jgi:hypothetical protein
LGAGAQGAGKCRQYYQLARLHLHNAELKEAQHALEHPALAPDNLPALVMQIDVLDKPGKATPPASCWPAIESTARLRLSATCPGLWLHHGQSEYALLGLSKAVELEPDNKDYRYDLATTLHSARSWKRRRSNCRKSSSATRTIAGRECC